jgi:RimJ/RimL family protein N-acetyltransferase
VLIAETERLRIRNWQERDGDLFFEINSDPAVMRFFPFRRTRAEADALMSILKARIADKGYGFAALALKDGGAAIGFAGLADTDLAPQIPDGSVEIGWRLAPCFWGKGFATEAAKAWLAFGFERLGLDEIVSFAVHDNQPSLAVMQRLGMTPDPAADFDHPRVPATHPQLKRHVVYRLRKENWVR